MFKLCSSNVFLRYNFWASLVSHITCFYNTLLFLFVLVNVRILFQFYNWLVFSTLRLILIYLWYLFILYLMNISIICISYFSISFYISSVHEAATQVILGPKTYLALIFHPVSISCTTFLRLTLLFFTNPVPLRFHVSLNRS